MYISSPLQVSINAEESEARETAEDLSTQYTITYPMLKNEVMILFRSVVCCQYIEKNYTALHRIWKGKYQMVMCLVFFLYLLMNLKSRVNASKNCALWTFPALFILE